jgi:hypothetical protein
MNGSQASDIVQRDQTTRPGHPEVAQIIATAIG